MKNISSLFLGTIVLLSLFCSCKDSSSGKKGYTAPNIIYILADDLGYGDLGCYGQEQIKTPEIDKMATEGMRFTSHYSGSTVCAPSRCSLMTGLHTGHCYIRNNARIPLRTSDITVATLLNEAGYSTALIGKWGLGNPGTTGIPTKKGFDYFFGYMDQGHAHNFYPTFLWRNEDKVELPNLVPNEEETGRGIATGKNVYTHDLFTEEALQFIEQQKSIPNPFFLYLAYTIPHANNEAGRELGDGMEVPDYGEYENKDWPNPQKGHAAMISRMDRDIGRLMAKLKSLELDHNTIVFFTSDNGPHAEGGADYEFNNSNGIYRGYKRDMYEGGIRVPLIVRWPGKINPGTESNHISAFWDMMPTFSDLAGIDMENNTDGISFLPTLLGKREQKTHDHLYWEFSSHNGKQAVRMGKWKGIRLNVQNNSESHLELYNLSKDPSEKTDVSDRFPEIQKRILEIMEEEHVLSEHFPLLHREY